MRIVLAAFLGGLVLFFWGFVANMLLPLGMAGYEYPVAEDPVLATLQTNLPREGVYMVPGITEEQYADPAAAEAFAKKSAASPYAFIVYQPQGENALDMVDELAKQLGSSVLAAGLLAWVLSLAPWGFGKRVMVSTVLGVFAWVAVSVPMWTWYRFPSDYIGGVLVQQVVGWLLAGIAIAWVLGRKVRRHHSI